MKNNRVFNKFQSPIEEMLFQSISAVIADEEIENLFVKPQARIGKYRADFLLHDDAEGLLVVECDGHDFHNVTKEQAAHDRRRDREILSDYFVSTVRFTGSEIYADAQTCAECCISIARFRSFQEQRHRNMCQELASLSA